MDGKESNWSVTMSHYTHYGLWVPAEDEDHAREMQDEIYEKCDKVSAIIQFDGKPEETFTYCDEKYRKGE